MWDCEDDIDLPEIRAVEIQSEAGVLGVFNRHQRAITESLRLLKAGELTQAEVRERLERMQADGERAHATHIAGLSETTIAPSGTARLAMERYRAMDPDTGAGTGGIVLQGVTAERMARLQPLEAARLGANVIKLPNGRMIVEHRSGYLTDPRPETVEQARIQEAYSNFGVAVRIAHKLGEVKNRTAETYDLIAENPTVRKTFFKLDRAIRSASEPAGIAIRSMYERVLSGASGAGDDWIAKPYLQGGWIGPHDLQPQLADRIPQLDAPAPEFTAPTMPAGELIARLRGRVQVEQPTGLPAVSLTTGKRTITIKSLVMRLLLDDEWLSDFLRNGMVSMEDLMSRLRRGLRRTVEIALLHGDTTSTHQDAVSTWTLSSMLTAGTLDGTDSPLKAWKGLRRLCFDDTGAANDSAGTFSGTTAMAMIARMGTRAQNPDSVWTCNINCLYKKMMPADDFRLWSSVGEMATARSGSMGQMLGRDVLLSEFMSSDLNASGLYDGVTTTKTALLHWDPTAFEMWNLLEDSFLDVARPEEGVMHLIANRRTKLERGTVTDNGHAVTMDYDLAA